MLLASHVVFLVTCAAWGAEIRELYRNEIFVFKLFEINIFHMFMLSQTYLCGYIVLSHRSPSFKISVSPNIYLRYLGLDGNTGSVSMQYHSDKYLGVQGTISRSLDLTAVWQRCKVLSLLYRRLGPHPPK